MKKAITGKIIRPEKMHYKQLVQLRKCFRMEMRQLGYWPPIIRKTTTTHSLIKSTFEPNGYSCRLYCNKTKLVGYACLMPHPYNANTQLVSELYVSPEARQLGIGSYLISNLPIMQELDNTSFPTYNTIEAHLPITSPGWHYDLYTRQGWEFNNFTIFISSTILRYTSWEE